MKSVNIHEAKIHLSRLVERVQAGEEIIIAKSGQPVARLLPIDAACRPVRIGGASGRSPSRPRVGAPTSLDERLAAYPGTIEVV